MSSPEFLSATLSYLIESDLMSDSWVFVVSKTNIAVHHREQHESVGKGECFYNMFVGKYLLPPAMGI